MKVVETKKNVLVMEPDDWERLSTLTTDIFTVCNNNRICATCPLREWCFDHENPASYLKGLMEFLDD